MICFCSRKATVSFDSACFGCFFFGVWNWRGMWIWLYCVHNLDLDHCRNTVKFSALIAWGQKSWKVKIWTWDPQTFQTCQGVALQGFDILVARKRSVSFAKRPGAFFGTMVGGAKGQVDGILHCLNGSDRYGLVNGWTAWVSASCCTVSHVLGAKSGILRFLCPFASKFCWRHTRQVKKCESCRVRIHITGTLRGQVWQVWIHRPHCKLPVKACRSGQIIATSQDLTPKGSWEREIPLFQGSLGWWNITIWPDVDRYQAK